MGSLDSLVATNLLGATSLEAGAQAWLGGVQGRSGSLWLANTRCQVDVLSLPCGAEVPVTLSHGADDESYVGSLPAAYVGYAASEAHKALPSWLAGSAPWLLSPVAAVLKLAGLQRAVVLDNWLLSTNLHPDWDAAHWRHLTEQACANYPDRPLAIRSVCDGANPAITAQLRGLGYQLVPARTVYLATPGQRDTERLYNVKQDQKLLDEGSVSVVSPEHLCKDDLAALRSHFRALFLDKYSHLNPDYTDAFFAMCLQQQFLQLYGVRYAGMLVGGIGLLQRHGWVTLPILGYDQNQPQSLGLYRRLMALTHRIARQRGQKLHMSSGAGGFKRTRGGSATLEYTAIYARHLPRPRQAALAAFATTLNHCAPRLLAAAEK